MYVILAFAALFLYRRAATPAPTPHPYITHSESYPPVHSSKFPRTSTQRQRRRRRRLLSLHISCSRRPCTSLALASVGHYSIRPDRNVARCSVVLRSARVSMQIIMLSVLTALDCWVYDGVNTKFPFWLFVILIIFITIGALPSVRHGLR